jgi:hypothetical protein
VAHDAPFAIVYFYPLGLAQRLTTRHDLTGQVAYEIVAKLLCDRRQAHAILGERARKT